MNLCVECVYQIEWPMQKCCVGGGNQRGIFEWRHVKLPAVAVLWRRCVRCGRGVGQIKQPCQQCVENNVRHVGQLVQDFRQGRHKVVLFDSNEVMTNRETLWGVTMIGCSCTEMTLLTSNDTLHRHRGHIFASRWA